MPLILLAALTILVLAPGVIYSDEPYQISLCGDQGTLDGCVERLRAGLSERNLVR